MLLLTRNLTVCCCVAALASLEASAESVVSPQGPEVNLVVALGDQVLPNVAMAPTGGWLVWQDNSVTPLGERIRAQHLDYNFTADGNPITVSSVAKSKVGGDQQKPVVVCLPNGGALVVWQGGPAGGQQIYARTISPAGVVGTADLQVSKSKNPQISPAAAALADGTVLVVWSSIGGDGSMQGIFAQRLSSSGGKLGKEFQVNQWTARNQRSPAVAALSDGSFVISWVSELQRGAQTVDVYARLFDASGLPKGNEFPANLTTSNACANPTVAGSADGTFAIAWSQQDDHGLVAADVSEASPMATLSPNGWDIFGRTFDANGVAAATPFRLNSHLFGDQYAPVLCRAGNGFLAVWTGLGQDGSREGIFGQAFDAAGNFSGTEFRVNTTTINRQIQPALSWNGTSRVLAVWVSLVAGTGSDLHSQSYSVTEQ